MGVTGPGRVEQGHQVGPSRLPSGDWRLASLLWAATVSGSDGNQGEGILEHQDSSSAAPDSGSQNTTTTELTK